MPINEEPGQRTRQIVKADSLRLLQVILMRRVKRYSGCIRERVRMHSLYSV